MKILKKLKTFLISFGGIYLDNRFDETYTYAQAIFNDNSINLYGYRPDSKQIQVYDNNVNILKKNKRWIWCKSRFK